VAPRLGAVAAQGHRAPAPLAGAAVVEEQVEALGIGAAAHLVEHGAGEKISRRPQHGRQQRQRRARLHVDFPFVAVAATLQGRARGRRRQSFVQRREIACGGGLALGLGIEQAMDRLAQRKRSTEFLGRGRLRGLCPAGEIGGRVQRLGGRGLAAVIARVDEIEAEIGAGHVVHMITGCAVDKLDLLS
jgi:hypothetical protein